MKRRARTRAGTCRVSLCASLLFVAGCGTPKPPLVNFSSTPRTYQSDDYAVVYKRWTRHEKVVREAESALEIWATFKSLDFREAFVAHYAAAYVLTDGDRDRLRQSQREAAEGPYEFQVTTQSANYRWNDIEKKNSAWRITLLDGAGHAIALEDLKSEKLPEMFEREFFPVKTPFTKTYLLRFPRPPKDEFLGERSGVMILRFASPLGHADLVWRANGPAEPETEN